MTTNKDRKEKRARQTATQRRHAKSLKEAKAPRREEIARTLLKVLIGAVVHPIPQEERATLRRIVNATQGELVKQGFSKAETHIRLRRILWPDGPISR